MMNRTRTGVGMLVVAVLAGCTGGNAPTSPAAPSSVVPAQSSVPQAPAPSTPTPWVYAPGYVLTAGGLSGVVFEVTPTGPVPVPGVWVYCDACGQLGHTTATTRADGFYSFSGDIASGGGVWLASGNRAYIIVNKAGYQDPPGLPPAPSSGQRYLTINGDTQFDIQLVRIVD